jgi:colanic acid/amylovoran biosynthesis glycosyltransferase
VSSYMTNGRVTNVLEASSRGEQVSCGAQGKVAYIVSRFPKLTETFVLYEMVALETEGVHVELYPLLRERQDVVHPDAESWAARAHYSWFASFSVLLAMGHFLRRCGLDYLRLWFEILRGTWGSWKFFVGALVYFPKATRFAREMEKERIQHIHAHFSNHPTLVALVVHRLTGIPFSFTAHGSDLHVERRMLKRKVQEAAFAVTVSEFNKRVMVGECGEEFQDKIHVVHCGSDPGLFRSHARDTRGRVRIVSVAALEEVKGHRYLIEACRLWHERGGDFECHLIGDGPERAQIEKQIAASGLCDRIHMHGARPRQDVLERLSESDIFVLASVPTRQGKREGIPVALIEAMASGLPVVASALSGIPELVEHERVGLLVPPGDSRALADALERLAHAPAMRLSMGEGGCAKVEREFNLRASARRLRELMRFRAPTLNSPEISSESDTPSAESTFVRAGSGGS